MRHCTRLNDPTNDLVSIAPVAYRRLKIEGGTFFYTLALADCGSDLSIRFGE
jgi:hypothetical protein